MTRELENMLFDTQGNRQESLHNNRFDRNRCRDEGKGKTETEKKKETWRDTEKDETKIE